MCEQPSRSSLAYPRDPLCVRSAPNFYVSLLSSTSSAACCLRLAATALKMQPYFYSPGRGLKRFEEKTKIAASVVALMTRRVLVASSASDSALPPPPTGVGGWADLL